MTQIPGYFPIRLIANLPFQQPWNFFDATGNPIDLTTYTAWSLTFYDSPDTLVVTVPAASFTYTTAVQSGGSVQNVLLATANTPVLTHSDYGYYELHGTPPGAQAACLMHGPYICET
jgi:hypothetical protein